MLTIYLTAITEASTEALGTRWLTKLRRKEVAIFRQRLLEISNLPLKSRKTKDFQLQMLHFWKNTFRQQTIFRQFEIQGDCLLCPSPRHDANDRCVQLQVRKDERRTKLDEQQLPKPSLALTGLSSVAQSDCPISFSAATWNSYSFPSINLVTLK